MQSLWIQEASKSDRFATKKIGTNVNPADLRTTPLAKQKIEQLMSIMGYEFFESDKNLEEESADETEATCSRRGTQGILAIWRLSNAIQCKKCGGTKMDDTTVRVGMRRTRSSDVCQLTKPTQVLLRIEVFNGSSARARGSVLTDSTQTGTLHDSCDFLISFPGTVWRPAVHVLSVTRD